MGYFAGRAKGDYFMPRAGLDFSHVRSSDPEIKFKTGDTLGATSIAAGTSNRLLSYNTAVTGKNALELKLTQTGILAVQNTSRGLYVNVNNESASAIAGELVAGEFKVRSSSSDSPDVKGIHVCIDAKGNLITLGRGIEISIDAGERVHGSFDVVQGLRVAANWSGSIVTRADAIAIEGPATWTNGINFTGSFSNTILRAVTSVSAGFNIAWLDVTSTGISGDLTGLRPRLHCNAASAGQNARGTYSEVIVGAGKYCAWAQGVLAHVSAAAGSCKIANVEILGVHYGEGASLTCTGNFYGIHAVIQTRGDENPGGDYAIACLENEAHGGSGQQMDSFLLFKAAHLSAGKKAAGYLLDAGIATDLLATGFLRLPDDETVAHDTDTGGATTMQFADFKGFIKVKIGTADRYILLSDKKPSTLE